MKTLIFGVGGFVGAYAVQEFAIHGYQVYGTDLQNNCPLPLLNGYFPCDLMDQEQVRRLVSSIKPDMIINLAAISSVGLSWSIPSKTAMINICGCVHIFESVRELVPKCKVLLVGSSEEYVPSCEPLSEESPLQANNPYGISKQAMEQFVSVYRERYGLQLYMVRAFNHTGVGQRETFVLPGWCQQAAVITKSGKPGVIKVGNLNVARDFSDVRDVVRAYRLVLESRDCRQIYNIGSGTAWKLRDLLQEIISFSDVSIEVKIDSARIRAVDNPIICCDNRKIRQLLGWEPVYDIKDTLKEMYSWFLHFTGEENEYTSSIK